MKPQQEAPDLSRMSSSELGRYGRGLHEHNRDSGVRHVLIARVLREARERRRHEEEGLGFGEWTRRYFGFGEEQALKRMAYGGHPLAPLAGQEVTHHQLHSTAGCREPVLSPLLANLEELSPRQITRVKRAGAAWVREGKDAGEVAALVAQAARGALVRSPRRPAPAALPLGKLGRAKVLRPMQGALRAVAVLRERRLAGEALSGTWPAEMKEVMRALLWQVPELLGQDPAAFAAELLAERRAAPRPEQMGEEAIFPCGEDAEKGRAVAELAADRALAGAGAEAPEAAGAAADEAGAAEAGPEADAEEAEGPAMEEVIGQLAEEQRAWLGERLFALLCGNTGEDVAGALRLMYEAYQLAAAGVSRGRFDRWLASLCGGDRDAAARWDAAFDLFDRAELPGFREQLYLLRTYPLGEAQRARVLALCQAVALYPRGPHQPGAEPAPAGAPGEPPSPDPAPGEPLSPEHAELLRDVEDLRRLQAEIEAAWSDERPLRLDVQNVLFEEQMELEKAVRALGHERRQRDAGLRW